ncbi:protein involved in polysaccharide export with SLBB domain [Granulicella aggregans]|uniref:Protein involved in polysaccharide export with SLBB domain n=1 Tax=Granulicella aggregans TaxID=474949 RepID=A0A7W7ZGY1_9BACT|nr:SLBB domain-containing protein [Granulicella aggregans]MBB5059677.1 protein involved in polysaccharide export with SLBB domain [Granulicella aggregans]
MSSLHRAILIAVSLTSINLVFAQQQQQQQQSPGDLQQGEIPATNSGISSSQTGRPPATRRDSLSAVQIDSILQQHPDLIVELKSLLADQLQQTGINALADSITDEQLYDQIALSASLRSTITDWLRARGYVVQSDLQRSASDQDVHDPRSLDELRGGDDLPRMATDPDLDQLSPQLSNIAPPQHSPEDSSSLLPIGRRESDRQAQLESQNPQTTRKSSVSSDSQRPDQKDTPAPELIHRPTPYNLLSLRDLYTQIPQDTTKLKRFGSEVFLRRDGGQLSQSESATTHQAPLDVPIGPDYILGSGDSIVINLSGGVSQTLNRTIDREGKIALPEAGSLVVAGLSLDRAQVVIEAALKQQFRTAHADVTIARLRTVRVYVVGDVQRPGAYDITSLSTPLNALFAAGGPTSVGSLRIVRHLRGGQLVREVDLYDFLLHGLRVNDERLQSGDTLLVPAAGPQASISGAVKRPAIYELKAGETLATLLEDAGGATAAASMNHVTIDRIEADHKRETLTLDIKHDGSQEDVLSATSSFSIHDGDSIRVAPILPYSESAVYLEGHVVRPGKYSYREGMKLSDLLRSYQDLLPEPSVNGDIVRLVPPDLHAETIQFQVADVLIGNASIALRPFDTVKLYGRYEVDSPRVTIRGEVLHPGSYALSDGMTAAGLVRMAGGFKRDALLESADLTSYSVVNGDKVVSDRSSIQIGKAIGGLDRSSDVPLKSGDILTIHQISGWSDIGASVRINGEAVYPGSYGLQEGERLSSVLRRAGGFRSTAYPDGAILIRTQVKQLEEKSREELIRQIETTSVSARITPSLSGQDQSSLLQAATQQQNEVLARLRSQPASGRLVIHIGSDIASWANTDADIELRSGDILTIPKRPGFVLVSGQVYNSSAITFVPGKSAGWYLQQAGGTNEVANNKEIFVVRANGSVIGRRSGGTFSGGVLSTRLQPGDLIVVPQKIIGGSLVWRNLLTVAQIASSLAITAAVSGVL